MVENVNSLKGSKLQQKLCFFTVFFLFFCKTLNFLPSKAQSLCNRLQVAEIEMFTFQNKYYFIVFFSQM